MAGQRRGSDPSQELLEGEQGLTPESLSSGDDRRPRASSGDTRRKPAASSGDDR